jgi:hypothetical protein
MSQAAVVPFQNAGMLGPARSWCALAIHSVSTIIFGVPRIMLVVLIVLLSAYVPMDGLFVAVTPERGALGDAARGLPVR